MPAAAPPRPASTRRRSCSPVKLGGYPCTSVCCDVGGAGQPVSSDSRGTRTVPITPSKRKRYRRHKFKMVAFLEAALADNDSYRYFDRIGGLLRTGPTNTNVCDLQIALVGTSPDATA